MRRSPRGPAQLRAHLLKHPFSPAPARASPAGGLDEYVLGTSPTRLASAKGESLREQMTMALGIEPRVTGVPSQRARLSKLAADAKRAPRVEPAAQLR